MARKKNGWEGPSILAIDTEATGIRLHGPNRDFPFSIATCNHLGETWYNDFEVCPSTRKLVGTTNLYSTVEYLTDKINGGYYDLIVFHNLKYDVPMLQNIGVTFPAYDQHEAWSRFHCTLTMSHAANSLESHDLKDLSIRYLDIRDDDEQALKKAVEECRRYAKKQGYPVGDNGYCDYWMPKQFLPENDPRRDLNETYNTTDAIRTARLYMFYWRVFQKDPALWNNYERRRRLLPILMGMERTGIAVRPRRTTDEHRKVTQSTEWYTGVIRNMADEDGFNLNSSQQLQDLLFHRFGFKAVKLTKTGFSTDWDTLASIWSEQLGHIITGDDRHELLEDAYPKSPKNSPIYRLFDNRTRLIKTLLDHRDAETARRYLTAYVRESYVVKQLIEGKHRVFRLLHPSLNMTGTRTTRWSSSNPNAQNISQQASINLRACFCPRPGTFWLDIDFSNLELRIFAHLTQDADLLHAFETGESVHAVICLYLHPELRKLYETDPEAFKKRPEYKKTKNGNFSLIYGAAPRRANATYGVHDAYNLIRSRFKGIDRFMAETSAIARKQGYVETLFGYRLYVDPQKVYAGTNYRIQGSAGDILEESLYRVYTEVCLPNQLKVYPVLGVHDQLIFEVDESIAKPSKRDICLQVLASSIERIMSTVAYDKYGLKTPVNVDLVKSSWDQSDRLLTAA